MKLFIYIVLIIIILYLLLVYGLGAFLSSKKNISNYLSSKVGQKVTTEGLSVETSPLMVYKIDTKKIAMESGAKLENLELIFDAKTLSLTLKGKDLPAADVEKVLLTIQKSKDKSKKFLENFTNYAGLVDINLKITPAGTYGDCVFTNLSGNMVWFNIPVLFPKAVLHFDGRILSSDADALLGGEKAHHKIYVTNFGTPHSNVNGEVTAKLTEKFKYVPGLTILDKADAKVTYNTKYKKNKVNYFLTIAPGDDLKYKNTFLGMRNKTRKFFFETLKDGNLLYWKNYTYSISENQNFKTLLSGNGLFIKHREKFKPSYIFCKTNGFIPINITSFLEKYVNEGEFKGALRFDFEDNKLTGDLEIHNTSYKDFFINTAKAHAGEKLFVKGSGKFRGEDFSCKALAKNQFENIYIYNMDLFLDRFIITEQHSKTQSQNKRVHIDNWKVFINQIKKDRLELNQVRLSGSLKENVCNFKSEETILADGFLAASGKYDFNNDSSCIDFIAHDIDFNKIAGIIFDLPNQVEGRADAKCQLMTSKHTNDVRACAQFSIKNAALTKFGTQDFMFKNQKMSKFLKFMNVDFTNQEPFRSNINGSFYLNNSTITNITLKSSQKSLSLLLDGEYNTDSHYADLNLYGNYNTESAKGIKLFFLPLKLILKFFPKPEYSMNTYQEKLSQIPAIEGAEKNKRFFRIKVKGDLKNHPEIEIKSIR